MTIIVDVKPEVQTELAARARARGMDVPSHAATLLEEAALPRPREPENRSLGEFEKTLDHLAQFSHKIPILPDEGFSRESLYQDHD